MKKFQKKKLRFPESWLKFISKIIFYAQKKFHKFKEIIAWRNWIFNPWRFLISKSWMFDIRFRYDK